MQKIFKTLLVVLMSIATSSLFAYTGDKMNKSENNSLVDWQQQCRKGFTSQEWTLNRDAYLDELMSNLNKESQKAGTGIAFHSEDDVFGAISNMKEVTLYNFESLNGYMSLDYKTIKYVEENSGASGVNYIVLPLKDYYLVVAKVNCYNLQLGIAKIPETKPVAETDKSSSAPASASATVGDIKNYITVIDSTKGGDTYITNNYSSGESQRYIPQQSCGGGYELGYGFSASASLGYSASCASSYSAPTYYGPRGGGGYVSGGGSSSSTSNSYNTYNNYYSNTTNTSTTNINQWYWNWVHNGGGTASNDSGPHNPGGGGPGNPGGGVGNDSLPHNPHGRVNVQNDAYAKNQPSSSRNGREQNDSRGRQFSSELARIDQSENAPRGTRESGQQEITPRSTGRAVETMPRNQQRAEDAPSTYSSPRQENPRSNPAYSNESRAPRQAPDVREYRQQQTQPQYSPAPRENRIPARTQGNVNPYAVPVPQAQMMPRQQMQAPAMQQQRSAPAPSHGGGGRQGRSR